MLTESQIKEIGIEVHQNFVDRMYARFSLQEHPGYCTVEILPMISLGGYNYNPDRIFLNDITFDNKDEVIATTAHESGHFLHPFARQQYVQRIKQQPRNYMLGEIICNFSVLIYFSLNHGEKTLEYHERVRGQLNHSELLARDIFNTDSSLLGKIATMDMRNARSLITPYLQRALYGENGKKMPGDLPSEK